MSARHLDRLSVEEVIGDWIICRDVRYSGPTNPIAIRHHHGKSKLVWETQHIAPDRHVCETCAQQVPVGVLFMFKTLKLRRAVEPG